MTRKEGNIKMHQNKKNKQKVFYNQDSMTDLCTFKAGSNSLKVSLIKKYFLLALSLLRGAELFKGCVESLMGRMETPKGSAE